MEKVIVIFEENHGFIGIASDALAAAKWLVSSGWMTETDDVYDYILDRTYTGRFIMESNGYIQFEDFLVDYIGGECGKRYDIPFHFHVETIHC